MVAVLVSCLSCQCSGQESQKKTQHQRDFEKIRNQRMQAEREFLEKERKSIETYIKDRGLEVERTGTGLYYQILEDSASDVKVESEDEVVFQYDIYLLNGTLIYSSEENSPEALVIDRENAEIGIHEALKKLGLGDKGLFILPSHLAFGVAGDQEKVPPKTALAYEIKVLKINKSKKE